MYRKQASDHLINIHVIISLTPPRPSPPPGKKFLDPRSRLFCVKFGIREEEKNVSKLRYIQYTNQTVTKVHLCILLGRTIIDSPNIYLKYNVSLL